MELGGNAVELEVAHVIVLNHVLASAHKGIEVYRVGQLEVRNLVLRVSLIPVLDAHALTGAVTTYGAQPCAHAATHGSGNLINLAETVGEANVEIPQAIEIIPAVVNHVGINLSATLFIQLLLPSVDDVQRNLLAGALGRVGIVMQTNTHLIPVIVVNHGAVGNRFLALNVAQE